MVDTKQKSTVQKSSALERRNALIGMSFILPNFIGFAVFVLIPVLFSFVLAFMNWDGFTEMEFVALDNFKKIFDDRIFVQSLKQTLIYTFFNVFLSTAAALGLAMILNQKLKGKTFFRSAIFFPYIASVVAVGAVWKAMFMKEGGPINVLLSTFGVPAESLPGWLSSTDWALTGVIIVSIWKNMGYFMVIYLAALQNIPYSLYEAAQIDGTTKWQQFWRITFPMLIPSHFFVIMMLTINSFKTFDLIFTLTEGGPGTSTLLLSMYIYNQSFQYLNYGVASAAAMVLFLIVGTITIVQFRIEKKFNDFM